MINDLVTTKKKKKKKPLRLLKDQHFCRMDELPNEVIFKTFVIEVINNKKSTIILVKYRKDRSESALGTSDHLLLDNLPNLGPVISRWGINKFENC
jgi:hypothetical protein